MKTELKTPPADQPETNAPTGKPATDSEALLKELAAQKDLHLRVAADFENFKRRSRQEIETRSAAQKDSLIADLLPVIDNLERALASGGSRDSAQFHQGVEMTLKQLQQLLRQHGVGREERRRNSCSQSRRFRPNSLIDSDCSATSFNDFGREIMFC